MSDGLQIFNSVGYPIFDSTLQVGWHYYETFYVDTHASGSKDYTGLVQPGVSLMTHTLRSRHVCTISGLVINWAPLYLDGYSTWGFIAVFYH